MFLWPLGPKYDTSSGLERPQGGRGYVLLNPPAKPLLAVIGSCVWYNVTLDPCLVYSLRWDINGVQVRDSTKAPLFVDRPPVLHTVIIDGGLHILAGAKREESSQLVSYPKRPRSKIQDVYSRPAFRRLIHSNQRKSS